MTSKLLALFSNLDTPIIILITIAFVAIVVGTFLSVFAWLENEDDKK